MTDSHAIDRIPTGISGLDEVTLGGLPARRATLVAGTTGSGKTLFAVEFLARGITRFNEPGVFVTFEETSTDIRRNAASLGFSIEQWEGEGRWAFVEASGGIDKDAPVVGAYDFGALAARIERAIGQTGARRVAFDSLGAIFARFTDIDIIRREVSRITSTLEALGVTSILTAERSNEYDGVTRYEVEQFVLDNVIILRNNLRQGRRNRTVEIVKFRGAPHRTGEWLFTIDPREGIVVVPLAFALASDHASLVRVSSGIPELDEMCGGGFYRDAVILISGATGAGKTLTSLHFAAAAIEAGERCLLCTFDGTRGQLLRTAASWGMDLRAMQTSGLLRVMSGYAEVASPEDHFLQLMLAIEEFSPSRLVIDTLSALERIIAPRALVDIVISLGAVVRQKEITTLLTALPTGQPALAGAPMAAADIASLTDGWIQLRYIERVGEIQRAIAVLKVNGSAHDHDIREVTIDSTGMHIGEPMSGTPRVLDGDDLSRDSSAPDPR